MRKKIIFLLFAFLALAWQTNAQCNYTLEMNDSYGDGWNGNTMDVLVNGNVVLDDVTLDSGSQGTLAIPVNTGDDVSTVWNGGGSYGSETSYRILDADGNEVGSGAESNIDPGTITATCPSCPTPSGLTAENLTATSADLSWTAGGSETQWNLEWGDAGFTQGQGTLVSSTTDNPYALSGLATETSYDFYVQADCGNGDTSNWAGPYTFTTTPINDDCAGAISIACGDVLSGSTNNATPETIGAYTGNNENANSVWYVFAGTGESITLSLCNDSDATPGNADYDTKIDVYSGDCSNLTHVGGNDDGNGCSSYSSLFDFISTNGVNYYIRVYGYSTNSKGNFNLSVECAPACSPIAANDDCSGAEALTNATQSTGDNSCQNSATENPSCDPYGNINDVWFEYTTDANTTEIGITFEFNDQNFTADGVKYAIYDDCSLANEITCASATSGSQDVVSGLNPNTAYKIQVWSETEGSFGITVQTNCPAPTDLDATNITTDSVDLSWTDNSGGSATYVVEWREAGSTTWSSATTGAGDTSYQLTGLYSDTEYEWQLTSDCGGGATSQAVAGTNFTTLPSCIAPGDLAVDNISQTTADFYWTDNNAGNSTYTVEWKEAGASTWNSATTAAGATTYHLTGLTSHTEYEWQLTADCGADGTSSVATGNNFYTACDDITSFPYDYGFEDVASNTGGDWSASCWSGNPENTGAGEFDGPFRWTSDDEETPSTNTGPFGAHSGNQYAYTEASGSNEGDVAELISPIFDMTSLTSVEISFYYHMYGSDMGSLHLDTYDGMAWTNDVWSIAGQQQSDINDPWIKASVIVGNNVTQFRFRGIRGNDYNSDMAVDDIKVQEAPDCLDPTDLVASNTTETTADLAWTDTNSGNASYIVEWREAGSTTWNSYTTNAGDTSYTVTGLNGKTEYEWQLTSDCGTNGSSNSVAGSNFITPGTCGMYTLSLYDSYGDGWNGGTLDVYVNGTLVYDDLTMSSGSGPKDTLIPVDINDILSFDYTSGSYAGENQYILTDETGNELVNEGDSGVPEDYGDPAIPNGYQACPTCPSATDLTVSNITDDTADLNWTDNSSGSASYNINWREVGASAWNSVSTAAGDTSYSLTGLNDETEYEWQIATDCGNGDVSQTLTGPNFTTLPSCIAPSDLAVDSYTDTTADLTWTDNNNGTSTYLLEWRETGATTWNSVTTATGATSYQLTGLTEKTHYEWQLTADCNTDGTSSTATGPEIYTWYCESVPTSLDGDGITQVVLGSETYAVPAATYNDLSDQNVATLTLNDTNQLLITFETGYTYDTNVWIDFNDNFVFDANELVYQGESTVDNPTTLDASFFLDPSFSPGDHYMRIGAADTGQANPNPCYNGSWGVTVDFLVHVTCSTIDSFPYEYGFEDLSAGYVSDWMTSCWSNDMANMGTGAHTGPYRWLPNSGQTPSGGTGPIDAYEGDMYAFTEASGNSQMGDETNLISPNFDMSNMSSPMISFYYHMYSYDDIGSLHLDTYDGQTWTNDVWSVAGTQQQNQTDDWMLAEVAVPNNITKFRLRAVRGDSFRGDIAVDNFKVSEACYTPTDLSVDDVMDTTATISWTDTSNSSAEYYIQWRELGASSWNQDVSTAGSTSFTFTGLNPSTEYEWRMHSTCGNYYSEIVPGENFTTLCGAIASFPYDYGFEDMYPDYISDWSASCWNVTPDMAGTGPHSAPFRWLTASGTTPSGGTGPASADEGSIYAYTEASGASYAGDETELYSPLFDMSNLSAPTMSFSYFMFGNNMGELHVDTYDGSTWTNDVFVVSGQQQASAEDAWLSADVSLDTSVVRIRFRGVKGDGFRSDMAIDNISIIDMSAPVADNPYTNSGDENYGRTFENFSDTNMVNIYQKDGIFNLKSMDEHNITGVQVFDLSGRLLFNNNYNEKMVQVELHNVATGNLLIFVIQLDNGNSLTKKAVKK